MLIATPPPASTPPPRAPSGLTGPGPTATWGSAPPPPTRVLRSAPGPWATAGARDSATRVSGDAMGIRRQICCDTFTDFQIVPPTVCVVLTAALISVWTDPSPPRPRPRPPTTPRPRHLCNPWRPSPSPGRRRWRWATATPHPRCPWSSPSPSLLHPSCLHYTEPRPSKLGLAAFNNALIPSSSRNCHISCQPLSRALSVYCVCNITNITVYCLSGMHTLLLI